MNRTVIFDLDNTGVDFLGPIMEVITKCRQSKDPLAPSVTLANFVDWEMKQGFTKLEQDIIYETWNSPGYFANLKPYPNFINCVKSVHEAGITPLIVTAANTPQAIGDKAKWFANYLDFLGFNHLIIAKEKWRVKAGFLIDDSPEQIRNYCEHNPEAQVLAPRYHFNEQIISELGIVSLSVLGHDSFGRFWRQINNYLLEELT